VDTIKKALNAEMPYCGNSTHTAHASFPSPLRRTRLEDQIRSLLARGPVVLLAPFGSGKSELLLSIAATDEVRGRTVYRISGRTGAPLKTLRAISAELAAFGGSVPPLVVIDNADGHIADILKWATKRRRDKPLRCDILMAARPGEDVDLTVPAEVLSVVKADDLTFTWDEFCEFSELVSAARRGVPPSLDAYRATSGWATAVTDTLTQMSRGSQRLDHGGLDLAKHKLYRNDDERDLLIACAHLPCYNPAIASHLIRFLNLDETYLPSIDKIPATSSGNWVTPSPMVRAALLCEARTASPIDPVALRHAAIQWFAGEGAFEEALTLAFDVGDRECAAELVVAHGQDLVEGGRIATLVAVGERMMPDEFPDERALIPIAWALMFGGGAAQARAFLRGASESPDLLRKRTAVLMLACLDVYVGRCRERNLETSEAFKLVGDAYLDSVATDLATLKEIDLGLFSEARERQAAFQAATIVRNGFCPMTYGEVLVALAHLLEGRPDEARFYATRAIGAAEALHGQRAPAAAFAASYLSEALFMLGRGAEVGALLADRLDVVERVAFPDGAARALVTLARTAMLENRWDAAHEALDRLDLLVRRRGWDVVQPFLLSEQVRLALIRGNDLAADRLQARLSSYLKVAPVNRNRASCRYWDAATLYDVGVIRIAWANGDRRAAESGARRMLESGTDWQTRISLTAFLPDEAHADVRHPLARLEMLLSHRRPNSSDAVRIAANSKRPTSASAMHRAARALTLTDREEQLLELLMSGLSYKHIASAAGISLDTVKWHLKRVYQKLQVNGRSAAVLKMNALSVGEQIH
jgi:LuxR family transcriptional regulator, maltose regulon positive regulatory protein